MSLNDYLARSKSRVVSRLNGGQIGHDAVLHVILGNEALDLDSVISSVSLAYLYDRVYPGAVTDSAVVIPLLPIRREDLALRGDIICLFQEVGVDCEHLFFLDDVHPCVRDHPPDASDSSFIRDWLLSEQASRSLRLTLTDHNVLSQDFECLQSSVVGIVDHHDPQHDRFAYFQQLCQECEIERVGSACTLIAERYLNAHCQDAVRLLGVIPLTLLIAAIVVDTHNLDSSNTTDRDVAAIDRLVSHACTFDITSFGFSEAHQRASLGARLLRARFNVSSLDSLSLFRRDYKCWTFDAIRLGMSTVTLSLEQWIARRDATYLESEFATFYRQQDLHLFVVSLVHLVDSQRPLPATKRQLSFYALGEDNCAFLDFVLRACDDDVLPMSPIFQSHWIVELDRRWLLFDQLDSTQTRKAVQPILRGAIIRHARIIGSERRAIEHPVGERRSS